MNRNEFIGNLSYYGKELKDFTKTEQELFQVDNLLLMVSLKLKISKEEFNFGDFLSSQIEQTILCKKRLHICCKLLNITDEDIDTNTPKDIKDTIENSVYGVETFMDTHLSYQDKLKELITEEHGNPLEEYKFSMN